MGDSKILNNMSKYNIEKLYEAYSDLERTEDYLNTAKEDYDNVLRDIKEINDELIKNSYVPWFELIKFALSDKNIDFNVKNKFEELNKIISLDFGLDVLNNNLSLKDIKSSVEKIKRAALEVKTSVENNGNCNKYNVDILEKIYKSIDSVDFLELIEGIISENNKKSDNILNQVKGKFAEHKFIEYLNNNNKTFFYIDNNQDSMCGALRFSKSKRPDLILILDKIFKVFVDVKNYSINKHNEFSINKKEIENFVNLEEQYSIPVFLAVSNGELQFNTWYFVSVNKIFEDKKDLIKKYKGIVDLYYINLDDPVFYKTDTANKFDDRFLIENNKEILDNIKLLTEYFKKLS